MTYTVYIKRWFGWRTIKNVKGDGVMDETHYHRWLQLADETRIEIPMNWEIRFSKERHFMILENMKKEAGKTL